MSNEKKVLSIIIPTYNNANYIVSCINSCIANSEEHREKTDIIVVDDGSTDETKKIIQQKYGRDVSYYRISHQGAPTARNYGFSKCNSQYCVFLDSDDRFEPGIVDYIIEKVDDEDIRIGNYNVISSSGNIVKREYMSKYLYSRHKKYLSMECVKLSLIPPNPGNKIYKTCFLKKNELKFDETSIGQDLEFFLKSILVANNIILDNRYFFDYRIVDGGISREYTDKILDIKKSFDYVKDFYKRRNSSHIYDCYISCIERHAYISQYFKTPLIHENRRKVMEILENNISECRVPTNNHSIKVLKTYFKYLVIKEYYRYRYDRRNN